MFELATHVPNLRKLEEYDVSAYDALYLGDFTCPLYPGNFSSSVADLRKGVTHVKASGKKCYLSLYAIPKDSDLPWIKHLLRESKDLPLDGIEVHSMGLLRIVRELRDDIPIHLGIFGNLYTDETARILKGYGVQRVFPNAELSLEEILYIKDHASVQVILPLHGKIPLVISATCFVTEYAKIVPSHCEETCAHGHWLTHEEWQLKNIGRANLSGKDLCMLEHLDLVARQGFDVFYIHALGEDPNYLKTVGSIYREALRRARAGEEFCLPGWAEQLRSLAPIGLCNGYYFGTSGQQYIDRELVVQGS
ncbi:MAG: peptidase U32 family protein [Candidatus Methylomirabilales bacterium]